MENLNDKLSVKNILFNKVLPNYVIPVPVNGHKLYACTGCGDKFIFESSYNDHINRKSLSITYMCRNCNESRTFYNRCNLLCHIRSHGFKSATINVPDLVIEPLPISDYKIKPSSPTSEDLIPSPIAPSCEILTANKITTVPQNVSIIVNCFECKENLTSTGAPSKDRACHYMQFSNEIIYSCPICLFALPSICAFKAHLRIHLRCPPYYCPECGLHLSNKNIQYPYNHDCEGFKMMRATARLRCAAPNCRLFHPNDYKEHMKLHMKKVYKCPYCVVACFNAGSMQDHLKSHKSETKPLVFYKCEMCPGKFVMQSRMEWHLKSHKIVCIFPCWPCGAIFKDVTVLLNHFLAKHNPNNSLETALQEIMSENDTNIKDSNKTKRVYRVVKRCDQCQRSFIYRCQYSEIHNLPNECPYKCSSTFGCSTEMDVMPDKTKSNTHITCHICKTNISQDWNQIKKHYAALHKSFKCMDAKIVLTRIDVNKYRTKSNTSGIRRTIDMKRRSRRRQNKSLKISVNVGNDRISTHTKKSKIGNGTYNCNICGCGDKYEQKQLLEKHLISHRDPCMAYQCMECGQCFVVKPSFSKHLLLEHNISDIEEYIKEKQCYNENALIKYQSNGDISNEPLRENQCKVCREDFESPEDLAKHFRGHGMAFLMKNNPNKNE